MHVTRSRRDVDIHNRDFQHDCALPPVLPGVFVDIPTFTKFSTRCTMQSCGNLDIQTPEELEIMDS